MQQEFTIAGMHCEACAKLITKKISKVENVDQVDVSLDQQLATITSSRPIDQSDLATALAGTDYVISERINP